MTKLALRSTRSCSTFDMLGKVTSWWGWSLLVAFLLIAVTPSPMAAATETTDSFQSILDKIPPLAFAVWLAHLIAPKAPVVLAFALTVSGFAIICLYLVSMRDSTSFVDRVLIFIGVFQVVAGTATLGYRYQFQAVILGSIFGILLIVLLLLHILKSRLAEIILTRGHRAAHHEQKIWPNPTAIAKIDLVRTRIYQKAGVLSDSAAIMRLDRRSH